MIGRAARFALCFIASLNVLLPQTSSTLEDRVRALYDAGQWMEAAHVAESSPAPSASLLFYRGLSLARLNNLTEAAAAFTLGANQYRTDKRFPLELAGIAYRAKEYRAAKRYLHRALHLDPRDRYGQDFLATLSLLDGNVPAALHHWNTIGKPLIQNVRFEPEPPLQTVLLERTFDISGGQLFTADRLNLTEQNLERLHVLYGTRFDLSPRDQDERFDLVIRSTPIAQPLAGWLGTLLPLARELPYQAVDFDLYNIHREAINFASLWRWDPDKRRINLSLSGPWRDNPRTEYRYSIDARDENWNLLSGASNASAVNFSLRRMEGAAAFELGLTPRVRWTLGGRLTYRDFRHAPRDNPFFTNSWALALENRFDYLLANWPDQRLRIDAWACLDTGRYFARASSRLIAMRGGLNVSWVPQSRDDVYRVTEQIQSGRSFGLVPLDELFMLGMERDNDYGLWFRGVVGTAGGRKGNAPMGREYSISQTGVTRRLLRIPFVRLDAGPFFDIAWTGDTSGSFGSRGALYAAGVEAKVSTIGGVTVRFVYGRDLSNGHNVFYTAASR